ncbi:MAG: hypothetical protein WDW38_001876 [Sanguina aurantia]
MRRKSRTGLKVYPILALICYFEVLLWTFCLLASAASAPGDNSQNYLLRETPVDLAGRAPTPWPAPNSSSSVLSDTGPLCTAAENIGGTPRAAIAATTSVSGSPTDVRAAGGCSSKRSSSSTSPTTTTTTTTIELMCETDRPRKGVLPFRIPLPHFPNVLAWRPRIGRPRRRNDGYASAGAATLASTTAQMCTQQQHSPSSPTTSPPVSKVPIRPLSDVFAGALARAASQGTIHPLDTLKVRLQTRKPSMAVTQGLASPVTGQLPLPAGLSKIGKLVPPMLSTPPPLDPRAMTATVASLYRGVVGAASGAGIAIGAYFAFYGAACNCITRARPDMSPSAVAFVSGGIAAAGSSFVKVPLAVCIRSVQAGIYPNFFAAGKSIISSAGVRGLFTGYLPTVLEDVPDMAIKFAAYESLRSLHSKAVGGRVASVQEDFVMGAFSGALAAAATTPLDVIKTNMMCAAASRPTMGAVAAKVYASGGAAGFMRGVGARSLSNGINSAVFFVFFEAIRNHIKAQDLAKQQQQLLAFAALPMTGPALVKRQA